MWLKVLTNILTSHLCLLCFQYYTRNQIYTIQLNLPYYDNYEVYGIPWNQNTLGNCMKSQKMFENFLKLILLHRLMCFTCKSKYKTFKCFMSKQWFEKYLKNNCLELSKSLSLHCVLLLCTLGHCALRFNGILSIIFPDYNTIMDANLSLKHDLRCEVIMKVLHGKFR